MAVFSWVPVAPNLLTGYVFIFICLTLCASFVLLWYFKTEEMDALEPPVAKSPIPIIGHILGFRMHQIKYLEILRRQTPWPAYTIRFFSQKTYVVASPSLSHVALRSKKLSLEPLSARIAGPMLGISKEAVRHLGLAEDGHWIGSSGMAERRVDFNKNLAPGTGLSSISKAAADQVVTLVNDIGPDGVSKDLYFWLRDSVTYATAVALYGQFSPVAVDRSLINDIWTFDNNQLRLSLNIFPSVTAREGLRARERLANAFEQYLRSGHEQHASAAVRSTVEILRKHGLSIEDNSRLEIFNISVATVNTTPTAIWMIINILAQPKLLTALRAELQTIMTTTPAGQDTPGRRVELDLSGVGETTCPLLFATYQEALRLGSIPTCNRAVLEDAVLTDPETARDILFKRGQRVVIPTFMLHMREAIWGRDADTFDPWRFMDGAAMAGKDRKARSQGFVPYGGGVHLCPGRYLAQMEILAVAGLMTAALDFEAADGGDITVHAHPSASGSKKPALPQLVRIRRRAGWEDVEWGVKV